MWLSHVVRGLINRKLIQLEGSFMIGISLDDSPQTLTHHISSGRMTFLRQSALSIDTKWIELGIGIVPVGTSSSQTAI